MRKPSPLPSIYQGSCLLGCCLGAVQKPFPATQPSHRHQLSAGRSAGTALLEPAAIPAPAAPAQRLNALAGSSPTYLLPVLLSKPFSGAREQKRGERLGSCRDGFPWLRRGRSARKGAGCSPCRSRQPVHGAREPGEPRCRCSAGSGVMGFLANPSPKPPQGPEQALGKSPSPSGQMKELPRGIWMRPLALQTWAAQPPSSAQHGEVVEAPAGGADIQRHRYNEDDTGCSHASPPKRYLRVIGGCHALQATVH